jgi:hypothetical protein
MSSLAHPRRGLTYFLTGTCSKGDSMHEETIGASGALELIRTSSAEARSRVKDWSSALNAELKRRPVRTLSIALGAGYLLGGGLFSRLTLRLASFGLRFAVPIGLQLLADDVGSFGAGVERLDSTPDKESDRATRRAVDSTRRKRT